MIEKQTFMKLSAAEFGVYEKCLEYVTNQELEDLSKQTEIEERFVKFLKYIEMLSSSDPKKVAG